MPIMLPDGKVISFHQPVQWALSEPVMQPPVTGPGLFKTPAPVGTPSLMPLLLPKGKVTPTQPVGTPVLTTAQVASLAKIAQPVGTPVLTTAQVASLAKIAQRYPALVSGAIKQAAANWAAKVAGGIHGLGQSSSSSSGGFFSDITNLITQLAPDYVAYTQAQNLPTATATQYTNTALAQNGVSVTSGIGSIFSGTTGLILIGGVVVIGAVLLMKGKKS